MGKSKSREFAEFGLQGPAFVRDFGAQSGIDFIFEFQQRSTLVSGSL
jgi:hypothetical protein